MSGEMLEQSPLPQKSVALMECAELSERHERQRAEYSFKTHRRRRGRNRTYGFTSGELDGTVMPWPGCSKLCCAWPRLKKTSTNRR